MDASVLAGAGDLLDRISERSRYSLDHTVVAIAGATGSGKSSLFNALAGAELSPAGVRRPTTASPLSCAWVPGGAAPLLDRLGVPAADRRDRRDRRADCDGPAGEACPAEDGALAGLVLLDLPDHDSAVGTHRREVERMLRLVDAVVWVVDPEKYADAVLHDRYLRPLACHADVTVVVLNQVDRLPSDTVEQVLDDLRGLLDEDGIAVGEHGEPGAVVVAASAVTGQGVGELREVLVRTVAEGRAARRRLAADLDRVVEELRPFYVGSGRAGLTEEAREEFCDRLADAVGATAEGRAAEREWARRAAEACATPYGRWWRDRRAGRDRRAEGPRRPEHGPLDHGQPEDGQLEHGQLEHGQLEGGGAEPSGGRVVAARPVVEEAVRTVAREAAAGLPDPWARAVRGAALRGGVRLPGELEEAALRAGTGISAGPGWWRAVGLVQWVLLGLAVLGAVGPVVLPWWVAVPVAVGAPAAGFVLARACRSAARGPARRFGQEAERRRRAAAAECGRSAVLEPIAAELLRYREVRERYGIAAGA
ncbi:GTPase [Streptomyces sp. NPDC059506]|uniref:GTPase n=1 Tax=Streptomyces sp. NPDC059506 TaxID=3347751 RepID=UPI0036C70D01